MAGGRLVALFMTSALVGTAIACAQIIGIGDAPPTKLACGGLLGDGGCQACGVASCCLELEACARSPACGALEGCYTSCSGDAACRVQCAIDHALSNDPSVAALTACLASSCDTACGPACGWFADFTGRDAAVDCKQCIVAKACGAVDDCYKSATCAAANRCQTNAPAVDVNQACFTPGLVDAGPWNPFILQIGACSSECAFGHYWNCLGHVSVPNYLAPTAMTVQLNDLITRDPAPNTTIKACFGNDPNCSNPSDTQVTDSNGTATLLPAIGVNNGGYMDIQNDAGFYPELFFWSFVLSRPTVTFYPSTVTNTEVTGEIPFFLGDAGTLDTTRGAVFIAAKDCVTDGAADVQFSISPADPDTRFFYVQNNNLSKTADRTDHSGSALAINVPVGNETLVTTPVGFSTPSSRVGFITRSGTLSYVLAPPTP